MGRLGWTRSDRVTLTVACRIHVLLWVAPGSRRLHSRFCRVTVTLVRVLRLAFPWSCCRTKRQDLAPWCSYKVTQETVNGTSYPRALTSPCPLGVFPLTQGRRALGRSLERPYLAGNLHALAGWTAVICLGHSRVDHSPGHQVQCSRLAFNRKRNLPEFQYCSLKPLRETLGFGGEASWPVTGRCAPPDRSPAEHRARRRAKRVW